MPGQELPRRTFLKFAALGAAGVAISGSAAEAAEIQMRAGLAPSRGRADDIGLKLGVASYSLRNFSRQQAIEMTKTLGTRYINLKSVHLPYEASPLEMVAARREIEGAGLQIVGGGMITFETDTDEGVRRYFDYAKAAGMPLVVGTCKPGMLPRIEKFVKQYDIKLAIHNHGPGDE